MVEGFEVLSTKPPEDNNMAKPILSVDFDGVIHSLPGPWNGLTEIPNPPVVGSIAFLQEAQDYFNVQIFSSRSAHPDGIKAMQRWLAHWAHESAAYEKDPITGAVMEVDESWTNEWLANITWPTDKPAAFVTLDDKAVSFQGSFPDPEELTFFRPWWKHD